MATCEGVRLDFSTFTTQPRRVQRSNNHWVCCLANSSDMGFNQPIVQMDVEADPIEMGVGHDRCRDRYKHLWWSV